MSTSRYLIFSGGRGNVDVHLHYLIVSLQPVVIQIKIHWQTTTNFGWNLKSISIRSTRSTFSQLLNRWNKTHDISFNVYSIAIVGVFQQQLNLFYLETKFRCSIIKTEHSSVLLLESSTRRFIPYNLKPVETVFRSWSTACYHASRPSPFRSRQ
jgi:hypothetical protein